MTDSDVQWEHLIDVLSTIYLVLLTPSVIGSISVLVVSIVRWRHLKEQVHVLVQLALADLLAALILMATSYMNKVNSVHKVVICPYSLPLSLTFYCISFLLVVVYAWQSKNAIQGWRARPTEDEGGQRPVTLPVYAIVWLIPISIYIAYVYMLSQNTILASDRSSIKNCSCILFLHVSNDSCSEKIHDIFIQVFLSSVVIPVILTCSVIYYKVGKWYKRHEQEGLFPVEGDGRSRRRLKRMISTARNMVMVISFCWTPALILIVLSNLHTYIQQNILFVMLVIQAVTVSSQGFLNSMVYAWRRPNFTEAVLGEKTPLVSHDHQAFFDESLRSTAC